MTAERRLVRFTGAADVARVRFAKFHGKDHLVVPVVAAVGDSVVRALGSSGPELVPADELERAPQGWNGRPVLESHPMGADGEPRSANEPRTIERVVFGQVFNTRYEGGKLKMNAYLDPDRAAEIGGATADVFRVLADAEQMVSVSVGCMVTLEEKKGRNANGESYIAIWRDIVPDHLAIGLGGSEGACSIDTGCGAPRAAAPGLKTAAVPRRTEGVEEMPKEEDRSSGLLDRVLEALGLRAAKPDAGASDRDMRERMHEALRATEPGFEYIVDIFADSGTVIYVAMPEREPLMYRRTFATGDDGKVTLGNARERVKPVTKYETVRSAVDAGEKETGVAEPEGSTASGGVPRGAGGDVPPQVNDKGEADDAAPTVKEVRSMTCIKQKVARLIANERSPFDEKDTAILESLEEAKIDGLEAKYAEGAPSDPPPGDAKGDNARRVVEIPEEEYHDLRAAARAHRAAESRMKSRLAEAIGEKTDSYTPKELEAMDVQALEKLARALGAFDPDVVDFGGRGFPIERRSTETKPRALPDTWGLNPKAEAS